jgi:peptide-methionine (R)-S-oxide reductase
MEPWMNVARISRRSFLATAGAGMMVFAAAPASAWQARFAVVRTDAEWRRRLTADQYAVLRKSATERPGLSPLNREKRRGTYHCAGCAQALFRSQTKFESGTGWPSFYAPISGAVGTKPDRSEAEVRTEVHCSRCGGHLGHVFNDGPRPTGLRYCMNGVALQFRPA